MQKLIATSGAARPTGAPPQRKLFRVLSGVFKGRLAALYMSSATGISLIYFDYPHQSWSSPQSIVSDSLDVPFGAFMDASGNIYLVYTDSSKNIKCLKLTFSAGAWNAGSVYDVSTTDDNYNPVIVKDDDGNLWCLFVNHQTSSDSKYYVRSKSSTDDGQTWGSGGADLGTSLSSASDDMSYVSGCQISSSLHAVYCIGRSNLRIRTYDLFNESWGSEESIHSADYIDDDFDIAPSADGRLGVVFAPTTLNRIYLKEFDGSSWSGLQEIDTSLARSPQIAYLNNVPHVFYGEYVGSDYYSLRHAVKSGDSFTLSDYTRAIGIFDKVFVYNDSASTKFEDSSSGAANESSGDVFHSESSAMLDGVSDCLYLGRKSKFYCAALVLSVTGAGGTVVWEYFDGSDWKSFVPDSGAYNFDSADELVYLWTACDSAPSDWQIGSVNNYSAYWVRARVTVGFSSNPVGTQILAIPRCDDLALVRYGSAG